MGLFIIEDLKGIENAGASSQVGRLHVVLDECPSEKA